jgi:aminoacyl tRNA synthase complex-interacting multifunctional protein 1
MVNALELLDTYIAELEARLNLKPGEEIPAKLLLLPVTKETPPASSKAVSKPKKEKKKAAAPREKAKPAVANVDQPEICKLAFKVGKIVKVWAHPKADKLYCEEIDVGEEAPREIASGLRPHFTEEQMLGQRLLVVANLKAKNMLGFKSHGMVLCASAPTADGTGEIVEFVEPPEGAVPGELVTFVGLPTPEPFSSAQVDKKKVFQAAAPGLQTDADCQATWNGHVFMTTAGPCKAKTIANGSMR